VFGEFLLLRQTGRASFLDESQLLLPCKRMDVSEPLTSAAGCLLEGLRIGRDDAWIASD
jgi:hypothetical protein